MRPIPSHFMSPHLTSSPGGPELPGFPASPSAPASPWGRSERPWMLDPWVQAVEATTLPPSDYTLLAEPQATPSNSGRVLTSRDPPVYPQLYSSALITSASTLLKSRPEVLDNEWQTWVCQSKLHGCPVPSHACSSHCGS